MLKKYMEKRSLVRIFRTVCGEEENIGGFIVGMSKHFLLLQLEDEFMLDGFAIIRRDDYDSIRHSSFERTRGKIFRAEGLLGNEYGFDKPLPLKSWADVLKALKSYDLHVTVQNIKDDYLDFWIGPITKVNDKTVSIHNYDPNGHLDERSTVIRLDTISVLKFGDRYSTTFRKYLKKGARTSPRAR